MRRYESPFLVRVIPAAILTFAVATAAFAAPGFELRPGVVASVDGSTLYLMQPTGGMAAVDVASGEQVWATDAAARPLYVDDEVLLAQVETPGRHGSLNLAVFDVQRLDAPPSTESIEMPEGVQATVVAGRRSSFEIWASRSGESLLVGWAHTRVPKSGVEDPSRTDLAPSTVHGAVRVPLGRGPLRSLDPADAPDPKRAPMPIAEHPALDGYDAAAEVAAVGGGVRRAGKIYALVELPTRDPRRAAVVRRWRADDGAALATVKLFGDGNLVKNRSADGRYLLGSLLSSGNTASPRYDWTVVDLASGQPVAVFERPDAAAAFFLAGDRVVVDSMPRGRRVGSRWEQQPLSVQGLDRATGRVLWSRAIRDVSGSGDQPPAR